MVSPALPASLADLQTFAAVARLCSFRRAALELGVSPSAVSHTLRTLEERLGVRLLNRTTRSVALTDAGERLLTRVSTALLDIEAAFDEANAFRDSPLGTLRINCPRAVAELVLMPLADQFLSQHPGMTLELTADDGLVDIVATGFDAGVRFGESLQQDMVAVPMGARQRFVVVASPAYLAAHGEPLHPAQLQLHRCLGLRFPSGAAYKWEFAKGQEQMAVSVNGPLMANDTRLLLQGAISGLGLAYVYLQQAQPALADGRLQQVLGDWCPEIAGVYLYYPSRKRMPAGLKAFVAMLQENGL